MGADLVRIDKETSLYIYEPEAALSPGGATDDRASAETGVAVGRDQRSVGSATRATQRGRGGPICMRGSSIGIAKPRLPELA